jgi:hypothetical protein
MALKFAVDSLDELPETIRDQYRQDSGGRYVLDTEGEYPGLSAAEKKAEQKFRERNIAQAKELEALKTRLTSFEGIDPTEVTVMKNRMAELERLTGTTDPKAVSVLVQQQVAAAIAPYEQKEAERSRREQEMSQKLARKNVESALRDAATRAGVEEVALPDFLSRGLGVFTFEDEQVIAKDRDGAPVFSKLRPGEAMSPEEWAFGLSETAPHLFRASGGGGAPGGTDGPTGQHGVKWVDGSNALEVGRNLEEIASGRMKVANGRSR